MNTCILSTIYEPFMISGNCENHGTETQPYSYDAVQKKLVIDGETIEVASINNNELQLVEAYEDINGDNVDDKFILYLVK